MQNVTYTVQRRLRGNLPRDVKYITITEVADGRVRGIEQLWPIGSGESKFDVALQPGMTFFKGSGSGKTRYYIDVVDDINDEKPFTQMVVEALLVFPLGKVTLQRIRNQIARNYPELMKPETMDVYAALKSLGFELFGTWNNGRVAYHIIKE